MSKAIVIAAQGSTSGQGDNREHVFNAEMEVDTDMDMDGEKSSKNMSGIEALRLGQAYKLTGHERGVTSVQFHGTEPYLLTSSSDRSALLYSLTSQQFPALSKFTGHSASVTRAKFHCVQQDLVVTVSADTSVLLHDLSTGARVRSLTEHEKHVLDVAVNDVHAHEGNLAALFATASNDRTSRLWDVRMPKRRACIAVFKESAPICAVSFGELPHALYTAGVEGVVRRYDVRKTSNEDMSEQSCITDTLHLNREGIITGLSVDASSSRPKLAARTGNDIAVYEVSAYVPEGKDRLIRTHAEVPGCAEVDAELLRIAWSPANDSTFLAAGASDGTLFVWDESDGALLQRLPGHAGPVCDVAFHPQLDVLASASADGTVLLGAFLG